MITISEQNLCFGCMVDKGAGNSCAHCGYKQGDTPESLLHLPPGTVLQNKYLLGRVLGQGGFGITYLAWDKNLKIKLAIKEYLPQQLVTRTGGSHNVTVYKASLSKDFNYGLSRFIEEARTLARFNEHPNIVTVRDYFGANNTAYLVMNYHEGVTLQSYLASKGGKITVEKALAIFMPVLDALKEVHAAGILHRDISPDNLLIDKTGRVILIDFGAARQAIGDMSKSLSVIMKAGYSPPEQYQSRGKQGPWTDIYAVAASFYRAITGIAPLEAIDRMAEDDLITPSKLGVIIEPEKEEALIKALAVKAEERYQTVEQFQKALVASPVIVQVREGYAGVRLKETTGSDKVAIKSGVADIRQKAKVGSLVDWVKEPVKKTFPDQQPVGQDSRQENPYRISKKTVKIAALVAACGLLIFGSISFLGGGSRNNPVGSIAGDQGYQNETEETASLANPEEQQPTYDPSTLAALDADYYIDYENGTILIGDLPIGARVVDPSWEWEFRTENNYSGSGEIKPVTWIIVAKDHYDGLESHVTLLSEELIGKHAFDNSTDRGSKYGRNHWGESGNTDATRGLRPWLNSNGIHSDEGFYKAFTDRFREAVITTTLPNKEWEKGTAYTTKDHVFILSTTELGDSTHEDTYRVGSVYSYFSGADYAKRIAEIGGETKVHYWTRSPGTQKLGNGTYVSGFGNVAYHSGDGFGSYGVSLDKGGVRPALNLKSGILVSEIRN